MTGRMWYSPMNHCLHYFQQTAGVDFVLIWVILWLAGPLIHNIVEINAYKYLDILFDEI